MAINWRGFWSGAGVGAIVMIALIGSWFYILGWRGRADTTMEEKIDRAKSDNAKERRLV